MNIVFTIALSLLIIASMTASIILISAGISYLINMKNGILNSVYNKIKCGKTYCIPSITSLNIPKNISKSYDKTLALYCADLIARIERPLYSNKKDKQRISIPNDMTIIKDIKEEGTELTFGMILIDTNNNIWIVFRGTNNIEDWEEDYTLNQTGIPLNKNTYQNEALFLKKDGAVTPKIHENFYKIYRKIRDGILTIIKTMNHTNIIITGHSLGGAMSAILTADLINQNINNSVTYIFGTPRVGDKVFADIIDKGKLYHIYNTTDIIPNLPLAVTPNLKNPNKPYFYQHCGELHPFTLNWFSVINNHLMTIHIHYLNTT